MADSTLTVVINADTSGLEAGVNAVNQALGYTKVAAAEAKTPVGELFTTLQKSSDTAVAGIIKGTESWQKAMFNIAQSLEIRFAQLAVNMLLNDTVADALRLRSTQTTDSLTVASNQAKNTAIATSNQTTAATSGASNAVQIIKQIKSDAAATYAGVYAFLSPVMGPAAAIPAGVASGSVAGLEGLVSLDVGAWNVPQNMQAFLHAGEMVVPQNFASGLRGSGAPGGTGGGDNYTINVNAIDTQSGAQFLKNNASVIAQTIASQVRSFNKNLPAWKS